MTILDSLHRGMAIEVWTRFQDDSPDASPPRLEEALGAFDMFVLHDQPQDLDYIETWFYDAAVEFHASQQGWDRMSTRAQALALARWLREDKGFTGVQREEDYRNLRNCMIGHALSDPAHPSLALVSSAV